MDSEAQGDKAMYESPIYSFEKTISMDIGEKYDNLVMTAVKEVGIDVDREELIKALEYDRDQYMKGYRDGEESTRRAIIKDIEKLIEETGNNSLYELVSTLKGDGGFGSTVK